MQRNAGTLYLIIRGISRFCMSLVLTMQIAYHILTIDMNPVQLVLAGTMVELSTLLLEIPTGVLADAYSRRLSVIVGYGIIGVGFLLESSFAIFEVVLIAAFLWALGVAFVSGALSAWLADEIGDDAAAPLYLRGTQVSQVTGLAGAGAAILLSQIGLNIPMLAGGAVYILLALWIWRVMPENNFSPMVVDDATKNILKRMRQVFVAGWQSVRGKPLLLTIVLLGGVRGLFVGGFERLWTPYLLATFILPELPGLEAVAWFGIIDAGRYVLVIIGLEVLRRRVDFSSPKAPARVLTVLYGVMLLAALGFIWTDAFGVLLLMFWLNQVALAMCRPVFITWINQHAAAGVRATVISMYWQAIAITQIIVSPFMGWVGMVVSLRAALLIAASAMALYLPLALRGLRLSALTEEKASDTSRK